MKKFIPYGKLSKKKRRELDALRRNVWTISPVTRKPESPKAYNRRKAQKWREDPDFCAFCYYIVYFVIASRGGGRPPRRVTAWRAGRLASW